MKKILSYLLISLLLTSVLLSCKTLKNNRSRSKGITIEQLYDSLIIEQPNFKALNAKFSAKYKTEKKSMSLKGNLKIVKDSVIWISLSPGFGIEAARLICTKDSVYLIDRIHKTLTKARYNFLMKKFKLDVDYASLEAILTNRFFIYPNNNPKNSFINEFSITSDSSLIKAQRKTSKLIENIISINRFNYLINNYIINDLKLRRSLNISYKKGNFEGVKSFPSSVSIASTNEGKFLKMNLTYKRIKLKQSEKISYNFPSSYQLKKY